MEARGLWIRSSTWKKGTAWGELPNFYGFDLESRPQSAQHRGESCSLSGLKKQRTKFTSSTSTVKGGMGAERRDPGRDSPRSCTETPF